MGLFRSIGRLFGGGRQRVQQAPTMSPQQMGAQNQALSLAMQHLQNPTQGFDPIAQQARSQFASQTVPSLAERFTSLGGGAQRGSGFQSALGGAGTDMEEQLAAMAAQYGLQNVGQFSNVLNMGLRPQFENIVSAGQPGMLSGLMGQGMNMFGGGMFNSLMPKSFRRF